MLGFGVTVTIRLTVFSLLTPSVCPNMSVCAMVRTHSVLNGGVYRQYYVVARTTSMSFRRSSVTNDSGASSSVITTSIASSGAKLTR